MTLAMRLLLATCSCVLIAAVAVLPAAPAETPGHAADTGDQGPVLPATPRDDDARSIDDMRLPIQSVVGRFTGAMVCTAAIVLHPRIIITAAHCIAGRDGTASRTKPIFQPAKRVGRDFDRFEATLWAMGSPQRATAQSAREAANDWAILVLDRVPVGIRPLRLGSRSAEELTQLKRQILMPSYAIGDAGALVLSIDPTCSVRGLVWNVLLHDCKARPGASGAPLLIRDRQWYAVIGMHSASILALDEERCVLTLACNSAIGTWAFADALQKLFRQLNSGDDPQASGALTH